MLIKPNKYSFSTKLAILATSSIFFLTTACADSGKVDQSTADTNLIIGLLTGQEQGKTSEATKDFILNGTWKSFSGNATTGNTIVTINAKQGKNGLYLSDSADFGGYSSCNIIVQFNNTGEYIIQNPENNGACFSNDSNKGKYFKVVYFKDTSRNDSYWYCTLNFPGVDTISLANAVEDNADRSKPGESGCGTSAWSRIDRQ